MKPLVYVVLGLLLLTWPATAQITLTQSVGEEILPADGFFTCTEGGVYWARTFTLSDFGISSDEDFMIGSGEVGFSIVHDYNGTIRFKVYAIDSGFPQTFGFDNALLGSSQGYNMDLNYDAHIVSFDFENPIIVPAGTSRILVAVEHYPMVSGQYSISFPGTTTADNDASWFFSLGILCIPTTTGFPNFDPIYASLDSWAESTPNFYVVVHGETAPDTNHILADTNCGLNRNFSVFRPSETTSVTWNFGDPSAPGNVITAPHPTHNFSASGDYTITAAVTRTTGEVVNVQRTIHIYDAPVAHPVPDLHGCEGVPGSGISTNFDTSAVLETLLGGQTGMKVLYYDKNGDFKPFPLPNPMTNWVPYEQFLKVRVEREDNSDCYAETVIRMVVHPQPDPVTGRIYACDDDADGFAQFDTSTADAIVTAGQPGMQIEYFDSAGNGLPYPLPNPITNTAAGPQDITAMVFDPATRCTSENKITLTPVPPLDFTELTVFGCDADNDGFSDSFDTSSLSDALTGGQPELSVSYFYPDGTPIPVMPNPYSNTMPHEETLLARVTHIAGCTSEVTVRFIARPSPPVNQPADIGACDEGDGFAHFDTSTIESQITGNQVGLTVTYSDAAGNPLPSPLPPVMQNTEPYSQTIYARVESAANPACYAETQFNLVVARIPDLGMEDEYEICMSEPFLYLEAPQGFDAWKWTYEDGTVVSQLPYAQLEDTGTYTLEVFFTRNGALCTASDTFTLGRLAPPSIIRLNYPQLDKDNYIEIIASGGGNLLYSIDGVNFGQDNRFTDLRGGLYTVYVKDEQNCGIAWQDLVLLRQPKFFTPNGDGKNDQWHIAGLYYYPDALVDIFDRYGKLIRQLKGDGPGWDGTFYGQPLPATDYWFVLELDGKRYKGHFSLLR